MFENVLPKDWFQDLKQHGKYGDSGIEQITNSVGIFE
jgi:hypothetical protein